MLPQSSPHPRSSPAIQSLRSFILYLLNRGAAGLDSLAGGEDEDSEEEEEDKEEDLARPKTHKERERMEKVSDVWDKIKVGYRKTWLGAALWTVSCNGGLPRKSCA